MPSCPSPAGCPDTYNGQPLRSGAGLPWRRPASSLIQAFFQFSTKELSMHTLLTTLFALLVGVGSLTVARAQDPVIEVYKSPT